MSELKARGQSAVDTHQMAFQDLGQNLWHSVLKMGCLQHNSSEKKKKKSARRRSKGCNCCRGAKAALFSDSTHTRTRTHTHTSTPTHAEVWVHACTWFLSISRRTRSDSSRTLGSSSLKSSSRTLSRSSKWWFHTLCRPCTDRRFSECSVREIACKSHTK